jgi:hypothetical protein
MKPACMSVRKAAHEIVIAETECIHLLKMGIGRTNLPLLLGWTSARRARLSACACSTEVPREPERFKLRDTANFAAFWDQVLPRLNDFGLYFSKAE